MNHKYKTTLSTLLSLLVVAVSVLIASICPSHGVVPPNITNTVPNIVARLEARGETVIEAANVRDSANMNWIILMRILPTGSITYSLVKTIGGGADGVVDSPRLPVMLNRYIRSDILNQMQESLLAAQLEWFKTHKALQSYIDKNPQNYKNASAVAIETYATQKITLPK